MKKILSLILASVLIFTTGCSTTVNEPPKPTEPEKQVEASNTAQTGEKIKIKFANYAILESGYEKFWTDIKTGFEAKNPNIEIEWVSAPYGEIVNQVMNMAGGGDKIDILFGETAWVPVLEDSGLSVPVDTILSKEFLSDFNDASMQANSINGKPYAVPLYVSPFVLYYNKNIFEKAGLDPNKPPTTYDEMLSMAEKISTLKTDDGNKVYAFGQTTASVPISGSSITSMLYNFGAEIVNKEGKLVSDTKEFKETFEMLKTLDQKGYNPQNAKLKDLRNLFALEQLAMYYDQSWGFNGVKGINANAGEFTLSASPLSGGSGKGESIITSHCFMLMDNGDAKKEAVKLLVEYIITPEILNDYLANITPAFPARKSMSESNAYGGNIVLKGASNSLEKSVASFLIPAMSDLNLELCTLAQSVTVGGKDVDTSIKEFKSLAEAIILK